MFRMRNAWATTLEQFWHSPTFPMWITLAAAGFFALVLLVTLIRAEKSVANGALTVITLLAIGIAVAATVRRFDPLERSADAMLEARSAVQLVASAPALSCLDGLAGEAVETPCERALFASADVAAAAVSYTAAQISKLAPSDDAAGQTPEQQSLRRALERDRYGLVAQILVARDHCTEADCQTLRLFSDATQIRNNMRDKLYDATITRYAATWNVGTPPPPPTPAVAAVAPAQPAGRPSSMDFPSAASIPPVNIMTSEPSSAPAIPQPPTPKPAPTAAKQPPAAAASAQPAPAHPAAAKKPTIANASASANKPRQITPAVPPAAKPAPAPEADAEQ
jgi:hypothetical protein